MVFNDTSGGQGAVQEMEAQCGLGATGITGNASLFKDFVRWANKWHKIGANYAIKAFDGHDFDDPNYATAPTGTFTGTTNRDYNFDGAYKMLKLKRMEVTYDGTYFNVASPVDLIDLERIAKKDPNVDWHFSQTTPKYDLRANGFDLYPKFTQAQVDAGAKVYVEWYRAPREFATSGTDAYEMGFDLQFHHLVPIGASYEYCKLYKPEAASRLAVEIYGNGTTIKGILKEMEEWYSSKSPNNLQIRPKYRSPR